MVTATFYIALRCRQDLVVDEVVLKEAPLRVYLVLKVIVFFN
jgi:hypothetical protein